VRSNYVVLASGIFDTPNRVGFDGEFENWRVVHGLKGFQRIQKVLTHMTGWTNRSDYTRRMDHVIVIGSGLSAADAILELQAKGVSVIHLYYSNKGKSPLANYSKSTYPEYHDLYKKMKNKQTITNPETHAQYIPIPDGDLLKFTREGDFLIKTADGSIIQNINNLQQPLPSSNNFNYSNNEIKVKKASWVLVLTGSQPSLPFLSDRLKEKLGIKTDNNNIEDPIKEMKLKMNEKIDEISSELLEEEGVYVTGSLAGNPFVRFGIGNNLGIVGSLIRKLK